MNPIRLALFGSPVEHSRSPAMARAAFAHCRIPGTYIARRVDAAGLHIAAHEVKAGELDGANITMPHKALAAELADVVEPAARQAGSVNTWWMEGGALMGGSTDIIAVTRLVQRLDPTGEAPVLILGAGGAAAAAAVACAGRAVVVSARRREAARDLANRLQLDVRTKSWGSQVRGAVVINATPLGMRGEELPKGILRHAAALLDMAYGSGDTPAVAAMREQSLPAFDGLVMLAEQAAASFGIWIGCTPPVDRLIDAARNGSSITGGTPNTP